MRAGLLYNITSVTLKKEIKTKTKNGMEQNSGHISFMVLYEVDSKFQEEKKAYFGKCVCMCMCVFKYVLIQFLRLGLSVYPKLASLCSLGWPLPQSP